MDNLKHKTVHGLKWSAYERFAAQGLTFVISIIIARILSPADYGVVGMIAIFTGISNVFINGGFSSALIRKIDRTEKDFSTVFYYNIAVSIFFYLILFFTAPWIARFYDMPVLTEVTRVVGLNLVIGAAAATQRVKLVIAVNFKTQAKISLVSLLLSGMLGITLAYSGIGVWALIIQHLTATTVTTLLLFFHIRWKPLPSFSRESFRTLFGYGSRIMLSGLLDTIFTNIYQVVIGKKYNATDLGYYTRASGFAQLPSVELTHVFQRVTFPVLSQMQNDGDRLSRNYRRLLRMSAFVIFPIMVLLAALSRPLVIILLTEKWLPVVPLLQVLCFSHIFAPIHAINLNLLQVKGRSDLLLNIEIVKKILVAAVLFISFSFGVLAICIGAVLVSLVALIINTHFTGKLIQLGFWKQIKDIAPIFFISVLAGLVSMTPALITKNNYLQLALGGFAGIGLFLGISYLLKLEEIKEVIALIAVSRSGPQASNIDKNDDTIDDMNG